MTKRRLYTFGILSLLIGIALLVRAAPNKRQILGQDGVEMVLIPAGEFQMGSNRWGLYSSPVHTIYVDAFYMDVHEVTNAQYKAFIDANPQWGTNKLLGDIYLPFWSRNTYPHGQDDYPVQGVPWVAAMAYAKWAGKRLPTEAEWEKAARGGLQGKRYPWGNTFAPDKANSNKSLEGPASVRNYPPNGYGLYDMGGNVKEWCLDEFDPDYYKYSPQRNPISIFPQRGKSIPDAVDVGTHLVHVWQLLLEYHGEESPSEESFTPIEEYAEKHLGGLDSVYNTRYVLRGHSWDTVHYVGPGVTMNGDSANVDRLSSMSLEEYFELDLDEYEHTGIGFRCVKPAAP